MKRRRKFDPTRATLVEVAYARTGSMVRAARVVAFISAWGVTRRELGHVPTVEEYAEFWGESAATAYRHQALFRQAFDRCATPDPVLDALEAARSDRLDVRPLVAA